MSASRVWNRVAGWRRLGLLGAGVVVIAAACSGGGSVSDNANMADDTDNTNDNSTVTDGGDLTIADVTQWIERTKLLGSQSQAADLLGHAVSIQGDLAAAGAYRSDAGCTTTAACDAGAAYLYRKTDGAWSEEAVLTADDAADDDFFGFSVAAGDDRVVVGAWGADNNGSSSGGAYVFERSGGSWAQRARLVPDDAAAGDNFGYDVALSGDVIVIGAWGSDAAGPAAGIAYVYRRGSSGWDFEDTLQNDTANSGDNLGYSVAVDGDVAVVGAWHDDDLGSNAGSASVFRYDPAAGSWSQEALLTASDGAADDLFGHSVALSGDTIAVGARHADDVCPDDIDCDSGAAYVFQFDGLEWVEEAKLTSADAERSGNFGFAVDVSTDVVVVGSWNEADASAAAGSVHVFRRESGRWVENARLESLDIEEGDLFGFSVAVDGLDIVIGASGEDEAGSGAGAGYVFEGAGD